MASISGTNVAAGVVPFTTDDTFPTHYSEYGKGGWKEVQLESDKDLIPESRRTTGMAVYVVESQKLYTLSDSGSWEPFSEDLSGYATKAEVDLKADKATTLAGYGIEDAYTKEQVDAKLSSVYVFKGSVSTYSELPSSNQSVGDVYNVEDTGMNYAWDGTQWDALGSTIDTSEFLTKTEASSTYAQKSEIPTLTSELTNDSGFLTSVPEQYVTDTELEQKGYITSETASATYATKNEVALKADTSSLSAVATTGSYNDLTDKPTIPEQYTLPIASSETLGGIKIGSGLAIDDQGTVTVSISGGTLNYEELNNKPQINSVELTGNIELVTLGIQPAGDYVTSSQLTTQLEGKADKATTLAGYGIEDAYTKAEVDAKVSSVYKFKGSVANYNALPTEGQETGDVYNVEDTGANYAWDGTQWDKLSETIDLSNYYDKSQVDSMIPTATSELTNDSDFITSTQVAQTYATKEQLSLKADTSSLSTVATTGSYNDLTDKPAIPEQYTLPTASSEVLGGVKVGGGLQIDGSGVLSTTPVGSTDYNDLLNKPQINSVELSGNVELVTLGVQPAGDYALKSEIPTVPGNITTQGNTFNGNSQLVQTTSDGKLPTLNGSNLTNLTLPTASQSTLGVVKGSSTTIISEDGSIEANYVINNIELTYGSIELTTNCVYKMTMTSSTTFTLPSSSEINVGVHNQIKIFVNVTASSPTINWGTDTFFNKTIPTILQGTYEFYFDFDPNLSKWIAGSITTGAAS